MINTITENIKRINELIHLTENENVGSYIDSTYLKTSDQAGIGEEETDMIVFNTIKNAIEHNMKLVMLRPEYVKTAREFIDSSLGEKFDEAIKAIQDGVDELDYVVNYKAFQKGDLDTIKKEVCEGTKIGVDEGKVVKWIIESAALTSEQVAELTILIRDIVIECVGEQKASDVFVKTSTGFYSPEDGSPGGATTDAVSIMSANAGPLKVKASGGIYSRDDLNKMIDAGASRVGTSAGVEIIQGKESNTDY